MKAKILKEKSVSANLSGSASPILPVQILKGYLLLTNLINGRGPYWPTPTLLDVFSGVMEGVGE